MTRSLRLFFQFAVVARVLALFAFAGIALALNAISVKLKRDVDSKHLMLTASGFQSFVQEHGRWPRSEEEYLQFTFGDVHESDVRDLDLLIVSYDCDLATVNLDSPEAFPCLRPRDPKALSGIGRDGIEELLKTLRKARDGELPIADADRTRRGSPGPVAPAGQASPDGSVEPSPDEDDDSPDAAHETETAVEKPSSDA